jgi:hypothetical protein
MKKGDAQAGPMVAESLGVQLLRQQLLDSSRWTLDNKGDPLKTAICPSHPVPPQIARGLQFAQDARDFVLSSGTAPHQIVEPDLPIIWLGEQVGQEAARFPRQALIGEQVIVEDGEIAFLGDSQDATLANVLHDGIIAHMF